MSLDDNMIERFSRQIILPEVGPGGQERLLRSRVLLASLEPAVATAALYLAAAGTGRLGLADTAILSAEDLAAALAFSAADFGQSRAAAVASSARRVSPTVDTLPIEESLSGLTERSWDLLLCAAVDEGVVAALNRASMAARLPLVVAHAEAAGGWVAGLAGYDPRLPCWDCARPEERPLGTVTRRAGTSISAAVVGTIAALESVKLLLGIGTSIRGRRIIYEPGTPGLRASALRKQDRCRTCRSPNASDVPPAA
jgi:molybdopterin/thiamine biosynthesis adenylyltransferase